VSGLIWIDVHNLCGSAFVCHADMNGDLHPYSQPNRSHDQRTMEIDDKCLSVAGQGFSDALNLDHDL
jgi:hypothetical protein